MCVYSNTDGVILGEPNVVTSSFLVLWRQRSPQIWVYLATLTNVALCVEFKDKMCSCAVVR